MKKLLTIMMAMSLLVCSLVACSSDESADSKSSSTASVQSEEESSEVESSEEESSEEESSEEAVATIETVEEYAALLVEYFKDNEIIPEGMTLDVIAEDNVLVYAYTVSTIDDSADLDAVAEQIVAGLESSLTADTFTMIQGECGAIEGIQYRYYTADNTLFAEWDMPTE